MGKPSNEKIKTVIMVLDNSYGEINFVPGSQSIAGIELRSHTIKSYSQLHGLGVDIVVLADSRVLGDISSEHLRQFLPEGQEVIVFKELRTTLIDLKKSKLDAKESIFVSADRDYKGLLPNTISLQCPILLWLQCVLPAHLYTL